MYVDKILRLMTSSNFVGCSMGRSAGFAPLKTATALGLAIPPSLLHGRIR